MHKLQHGLTKQLLTQLHSKVDIALSDVVESTLKKKIKNLET